MDEGTAIVGTAIEASTVFEGFEPEVLQKAAHGGQIRRGKADVRDVLDLDDRHAVLSRLARSYARESQLTIRSNILILTE